MFGYALGITVMTHMSLYCDMCAGLLCHTHASGGLAMTVEILIVRIETIFLISLPAEYHALIFISCRKTDMLNS